MAVLLLPSLPLQLNAEAMDLAVVELIPRDDGRVEERPPPAVLTSHHVTVLDLHGSLQYAGARTPEARLPDPAAAKSAVVVIRLRRRTSLGAAFVKVVADYADRLAAEDGRLCLSGLEPSLTERLSRTGHLDGPVRRFEATLSSASRPRRPTSTPRHGWSRGTADEPALGRLRHSGVVSTARGRAKPRPVAAGQRIGGRAVHDHAEQHGERDDRDRGPGDRLA